VRRRYPSVQRGRVSSLTTLIPLFPRPSGGSVPICATWMVTSFRHPLPVESGSVCATWTNPTSRILPRDVSVPVCAAWTGTSSRPSLLSLSSHPLTHPEDDSSVGGIDSPRPATRPRLATCAAPCVPRFAFPLTPHDLHHALRPV
jgi:hypothetical protein